MIDFIKDTCSTCSNMRWRVGCGGGIACILTGEQIPSLFKTCDDYTPKYDDDDIEILHQKYLKEERIKNGNRR